VEEAAGRSGAASMDHEETTLECPNCGKSVSIERRAQNPHFPFCCKRCRLLDLDRWLREEYKIEGPESGAANAGSDQDQGGEWGDANGLDKAGPKP